MDIGSPTDSIGAQYVWSLHTCHVCGTGSVTGRYPLQKMQK